MMTDWLLDLFTIEHLAYFMLGVVTAGGWHLIKARIQRNTVVIHWKYIGVPLALCIIVYVAAQNQQNANCVREFNQVLRVRSGISMENDQLSRTERTAFADWLRVLLNPPPEIAGLADDDPRYQKWGRDVTEHYYTQIRAIEDQQIANDKIRANNPLPEPTCGR
jgi:hypothetical protein